MPDTKTFIIYSEYGELLDLALYLKNIEKQNVLMHISSKQHEKIGDGLIEKVSNWLECLGKGYVWVFDGCSHGAMQDKLRAKGELVFGGSEKADKLENDRQIGQKLFKIAGFPQSDSKNFKDLDDALTFVEKNKQKRWVLKQNGDAPKSINHMGKFPDSVDMIYHLNTLKKRWNESEFGKFDCDLMEIVEGTEVAASAFFNGSEYLKNKEGKIVGYISYEEKKETDDHGGETTGEMGTTCRGATEDDPLFKEIIMRPKITEYLKRAGFRGIFDINGCQTKNGYVAFEATCRFGIPTTSYEFIEALTSPAHELIYTIAAGETTPIEIDQSWGMVMVLAAKPFPIEADLENEATSIGEKLWILRNGKPVDDFNREQRLHIHLQNFFKDDGAYHVATKNGYLLTVTARGKTIGEVRDNLIKYIKDNLYISGQKYRTDIGVRVEKSFGPQPDVEKENKQKVEDIQKEIEAMKEKYTGMPYENVILDLSNKFAAEKASYDKKSSDYEQKIAELTASQKAELTALKKMIRKALYV